MCVCVCVCVRVRENDRERSNFGVLFATTHCLLCLGVHVREFAGDLLLQ